MIASHLSKPSVKPRQLTPEEHQLFQNPDKLHGKQFILSPHSDDSVMYEVIGYHRKRDKSVQYDVLLVIVVTPSCSTQRR
jgi:hypothetical protein